MYDCIIKEKMLKKCPKNKILHTGSNNIVTKTSRTVLQKLLSLKGFVERTLPDCNVCIFSLTLRTDNGKASLTVNNLNEHLSTLQLDIIHNSNISNTGLSRRGLHLNSYGSGKLAINIIKKIKSFKRFSQVAGNTHKKFFYCYFYQNSEMSCLEVEDSGSSDKFNLNELYEIRLTNPNMLIFEHINIKSLRNKFDILQEVIENGVDVLLTSLTKLYALFPSSQFILDGFTPIYRIMRFVRENIPSKLLNADTSISGIESVKTHHN